MWDDDPGADQEAIETARLDADLEQAEMTAVGDAIARAQRAGVCTHGSAVGYRRPVAYPEQEGLEPGQLRCTNLPPAAPGGLRGCGQVFGSNDEWMAAMEAALEGF